MKCLSDVQRIRPDFGRDPIIIVFYIDGKGGNSEFQGCHRDNKQQEQAVPLKDLVAKTGNCRENEIQCDSSVNEPHLAAERLSVMFKAQIYEYQHALQQEYDVGGTDRIQINKLFTFVLETVE